MKSILIIQLLLTICFIHTSMSQGIEVSQCDLAIDVSNTKLYTDNEGNIHFKSIVRHRPPSGNDDAGHNISVYIHYADFFELSSIRASINDIPIDLSEIVNQPTFSVITLPNLNRMDHADIELVVENPNVYECGYQFHISAFAGHPIEFDESDNYYSIGVEPCTTRTSVISLYDLSIFKTGIQLVDLCKYTNSMNCIQTTLYKNTILEFPNVPQAKNILLKYKEKVIAKTILNPKTKVFQIKIPKTFDRINIKDFTLSISN